MENVAHIQAMTVLAVGIIFGMGALGTAIAWDSSIAPTMSSRSAPATGNREMPCSRARSITRCTGSVAETHTRRVRGVRTSRACSGALTSPP